MSNTAHTTPLWVQHTAPQHSCPVLGGRAFTSLKLSHEDHLSRIIMPNLPFPSHYPRPTTSFLGVHGLIMYNFKDMDIKELTQLMHQFVSEKGWYQPGSPRPQTAKNLAVSLNIEAAEILELFQWHEQPPDPQKLAGECADVALYLLQLASVSGIDLEQAIIEKLAINKHRTWDQTKQDQ